MRGMPLTILLCCALGVRADTLRVADALALALEHHYGIRRARIDEASARTMHLTATGAFLPTASLTASSMHTRATPAPPAGQQGWAHTAGATLNWTLFDGFKMVYQHHQLGNRVALAAHHTRHSIESAAVGVLASFYALVSARSLLDAAREQLALSQEHRAREQARFDYGRSTRQMLLARQVTLNEDSAAVNARALEAATALHELNIALGRTPDAPLYPLADTLVPSPRNTAAWWYEQAGSHNTGLAIAQIQTHIARTDVHLARAAFWPRITATGNYNHTWTPGTSERLQGGISANWPLFTGFHSLTAVRTARLQEGAAHLMLEQRERELMALVYEQWEQFVNAHNQYTFERQALEAAQLSMELAREQLGAGTITAADFRQAQLALLMSRIRLESSRFRALLGDARLRQLAGVLRLE